MMKIFGRKQSNIKERVVGWEMTPEETKKFFSELEKQVITFFGYSSAYEDEKAMLNIVKNVLSEYSPESQLVNIGATASGIGQAYPVAKSMGFITTGIVSSVASQQLKYISNAVDHICFVKDEQWGGKLPDSEDLSPTSEAMVACSDILIAIGGNEICLYELTAGRDQGKPIHFYPAEINHKYWKSVAKKKKLPAPQSFWGAAHEVFADKGDSFQ
jgi:hypothetical protein